MRVAKSECRPTQSGAQVMPLNDREVLSRHLLVKHVEMGRYLRQIADGARFDGGMSAGLGEAIDRIAANVFSATCLF